MKVKLAVLVAVLIIGGSVAAYVSAQSELDRGETMLLMCKHAMSLEEKHGSFTVVDGKVVPTIFRREVEMYCLIPAGIVTATPTATPSPTPDISESLRERLRQARLATVTPTSGN